MATGEERGTILAVVAETGRADVVRAGGSPVFLAGEPAEAQRMALLLARALDASVHEVTNGVLVVVRH
ncbi:MAG: hypothetical protein QN155_11975 [Armatimonadota bacterium]|nr:hypothetical protein [Armatimonadota bacterium]